MTLDQFAQGSSQFFFAAEDDVLFLQVGGETEAVQLGPRRQRAADVPGIDGAADGTVHQMDRIGDGVEHHPRTAEDAGPLADRTGQTVLVADDVKRRFALDVDLILSFVQCHCFHDCPLGVRPDGASNKAKGMPCRPAAP